MKIASEGFTELLFRDEVDAHLELSSALSAQTKFFKEKSRLHWLGEGDRNSASFYRYACNKKKNNNISMLLIDDLVCTDSKLISEHIVGFYKSLFNGNSEAQNLDFGIIREFIPNLVSQDDNYSLTRVPCEEEIKLAIFSMNESSAPGPDGFGGVFYRSCWDIIHKDVSAAVQEFFITGSMPSNLNSNFMVLIPKQESSATLDKFRPIALGNFLFKIITRILADRLNPIASRIISPQQFGFIRGRRIHDCIAIASEGVNCLDGLNSSRNMAIQVDIKKAFDTLDWRFLLKVLKCFGFSDLFGSWVNNILGSARISILINGYP